MKTTRRNAIAMVAMSLLLSACGAGSKNNADSGKAPEAKEAAAPAADAQKQDNVSAKPVLKQAKVDEAAKMLTLVMAENAGDVEAELKGKTFTAADFGADGVFSHDNLLETDSYFCHIVDKFWAVERADGSILGFLFKEGEDSDLDQNGNPVDKEEEIKIAFAFEMKDGKAVNVTEKYIPDEKSIVPYTKIKPDLIWQVRTNHYGFGKIRCAVETDGDGDVVYFAWDGEKFVVSEP